MEFPEDIPRAHLPLVEAFEDLDEAVQLYEDGMTARNIPLALQPAWRSFLRARHDTDSPSGPSAIDPGSVRAFRDHLFALMTTVPDAATRARAPTLDRWCVIRSRGHCLLIGRVNGHPLLRENARATTSPLIRIARAAGWARTWSRLYRLLAPGPSFFLDLQRDDRLRPCTEIVWENDADLLAPLSGPDSPTIPFATNPMAVPPRELPAPFPDTAAGGHPAGRQPLAVRSSRCRLGVLHAHPA